MPTLNAQGADLHFQSLGAGEPIVMLHGLLLGNIATWYFGAASSLAKSHRVIVYDLRGHGLSGKAPSGYNLDTMVADLKALVDSQDLESVSLVGHSYGALVALRFAIRFPHRVKKLVLVEGPLPPSRGMQMEEFLGMDQGNMVEALPQQLQSLIGRDSRQSRKMIQRLQFLVSETNLLAELKAEKDVDDEDLKQLRMPIQLIYGTESQLVDVGNRLQQNIPHAQLHWLAGGHYLPSELPVQLGQTIGDFFT